MQAHPIALEFALRHWPLRIARAPITYGSDIRVLVGRHHVLNKLSDNPIGFLGRDHTEATSRYGQRSGAAIKPVADDHEVGHEFVGVGCEHAVTCRSRARREVKRRS